MFREINSPTFHTQIIGRIKRMPEGHHYDKEELNKGFPKIHKGIASDAVATLSSVLKDWSPSPKSEWLSFVLEIREQFDFPDPANIAKDEFVELHKFIFELGEYLQPTDVIVPCSSGGHGIFSFWYWYYCYQYC